MDKTVILSKKSTMVWIYILFLLILGSVHIQAGTVDDGLSNPSYVRVGLVTYYEGVEYVHFYNKSLTVGSFVDNRFVEDTSIDIPSKDMWFCAATKLYLESDQVFGTFNEAYAIAAPLRESGYKAYATFMGQGEWKVFVGHKDTVDELSQILSQVNGTYDVTYQQAPSSSSRVLMESYDLYPIMFENRNMTTVFGTNDRRGEDQVIDLGKRSYRDYMEIYREGNSGILPVNLVEINHYLYSVVISEVYASWPEESLMAQAIAARTFASYYTDIAGKYPGEAYDLDDTVNSQVYKGYSIEDERVNSAVDKTVYKKIYYNDQVIPAYFFASSGGRTENSENVWSGTVPYLRSVPDIYEQNPERHPWVVELTPSEISNVLKSRGVDVGTVTDLIADGYSRAGRVMDLKVVGTGGTYVLSKETMRYWLGMYSRKFTLIKNGDTPDTKYPVMNGDGVVTEVDYNGSYVVSGSGNVTSLVSDQEQMIVLGTDNIINQPLVSGIAGTFLLAGEGWGHGVGMSQAGAKGMALAGFDHEAILTHYYSGVRVY